MYKKQQTYFTGVNAMMSVSKNVMELLQKYSMGHPSHNRMLSNKACMH